MWSHSEIVSLQLFNTIPNCTRGRLIIPSTKGLTVLYASALGWIFVPGRQNAIQLFDKFQEFVPILLHRNFGAKLLDSFAI
jgi:hypothetical protein